MATGRKRFGSFLFVPSVRYAPPVTEHVPLHSKTLCNYIACANNMHPLSGGGEGVGGTNGRSNVLYQA